jgi:Co/Zn/Cd efflux system component
MCMREGLGGSLLMDAKYGTAWAGWYSLDPLWSHRVGLWKNIRKGWSLFCSHTRFILGNGSRSDFGMMCCVESCPSMKLSRFCKA